MTESIDPTLSPNQPQASQPPPPPPPPAYGTAQTPAVPNYGAAPAAYGQTMAAPIGKVRGTGTCILLSIVTLGIYSWFWYFKVHEEMKAHSGQGIGGAIALLLAVFIGIASPYIASAEVGGLYTRAGRKAPVSGATGLWYFPGIFILVGPIVWFVKTNGALNDYWRSVGAA